MFQGVNSSYLPNSCEKLVGVKAFTSIFPYLLLYLCSTLHWVSKMKHKTVFLLIKTSSIIFFCLALLSVSWYLGCNFGCIPVDTVQWPNWWPTYAYIQKIFYLCHFQYISSLTLLFVVFYALDIIIACFGEELFVLLGRVRANNREIRLEPCPFWHGSRGISRTSIFFFL